MLVPGPRDLIDMIRDLQRRVRRLEVRKNPGSDPFTVTHTLLAGGAVQAGDNIPPMKVTLDDPDAHSPESKTWVRAGAEVEAGSVTVSWELNGTAASPTGQAVADGDRIKPIIDAATAAQDMSAWVTIRIVPGG